MPRVVGDLLVAAQEERGVGHGEQARAGPVAEDRRQGEQLPLPADLSRQRRAAGTGIADHLIGGEAERAELHALAQQAAHGPYLVIAGPAFVRPGHPDNGGPQRDVADQEGVVDQHVQPVEPRRVRGEVGPVERHAGLDGALGDLLDGAQGGHQVPVRLLAEHGCQGVPAISGHHGGDAETRGRREIGVPEQVGVEMGVRVDETRGEEQVARVHLLAGAAGDVATHLRDPPPADGHVPF